jgi:hypothetical protein
MQTFLRVVALLIVALIAACATPIQSEHLRGADFTGYHKFYWRAPPPNRPVRNPITDSTIVDLRVQQAVVQTLTNRGFQQVSDPAQADFVVTYLTSTQQQIRSSGGVRVGVGFGYPFYNPFFGSAFYPAFPYDVRSYQQANLIIDIIDAHTHQLVWRGWTSSELTRANYSSPAVDEAVKRILAEFPPAR